MTLLWREIPELAALEADARESERSLHAKPCALCGEPAYAYFRADRAECARCYVEGPPRATEPGQLPR